jgi:hypothetical protein
MWRNVTANCIERLLLVRLDSTAAEEVIARMISQILDENFAEGRDSTRVR